MRTVIKNILYGIVIGSSMLLPGVSGGTTAIILGIYDRLIKSVSELWKDWRKNGLFLMEIAVGGMIGAGVFAKGMLWLTGAFPYPMIYLFMGAIFGSIPLMVRKAHLQRSTLWHIAFVMLGVMAALGIRFLPKGGFSGNWGMLVICGIVISIALILPGISTSHILLVLGIYESVLQAVSEMDFVYIGILGTGVITGIFLCTKILEKALSRFPSQTFMAITGFVMTSVYDIFPGIPSGTELVISIGFLITAFVLVAVISLNNNVS